MRTVLIWFLAPALGGLYLFTLAGLAAPLIPILDLINHFRIYILETAVLLFLIILWMRSRWLWRLALVLVAINLGLTVPAFFPVAAPAGPGGDQLKLLLYNAKGRASRIEQLEQFVRAEDPDLILMTEAGDSLQPMIGRLRAIYPHQVDCMDLLRCRLLLLSKRPLANASATPRRGNQGGNQGNQGQRPPLVRAEIETGGGKLTLLGVHVSRPFYAREHFADLAGIRDTVGATSGPVLLAGDFNATPWSWSLYRFQRQTGLLRHRTLGVTWPERAPLTALLLIDHVLTRGPITTLGARSGPNMGSDHLPVVTRISLP
jgi:endonuclease/exonuclease/phosphatase (EEP) superfamily protein YafD